jgi:hypothetical protein
MTNEYRVSGRRTLQLALWTIAWIITLAAAKFGPWGSPELTWVAIGVNIAVGIGVIVAFTRFLRSVDDLDRKIMLDALGVTLGAAAVVGFAWIVADDAGVLGDGPSIALFPVALAIVFVGAIVVGKVRYR